MSKLGGGGTSPRGGASPRGKPASSGKNGYVPPPPEAGAQIEAPPTNAKVKTFKVSSGPCPGMMSLPNISSAPQTQVQVSSVEETKAEPAPA